MFDFIKKILTPSNEGEIKKLRKTVDRINALEGEVRKLSDDGMRAHRRTEAAGPVRRESG